MAAPSVGRQSCAGQKESGGLDYSKPPQIEMAREKVSAWRRLFFFCRRAAEHLSIKLHLRH